jgi:class 3 adenylate cyclase
LNAHRRSRVGAHPAALKTRRSSSSVSNVRNPVVSAVFETQRSAQSANWTVQVGGWPAETTIEGERKTVTTLSADIKGSTELMRDLDPDEALAIIDPVLQ